MFVCALLSCWFVEKFVDLVEKGGFARALASVGLVL